MNIIFLDIDGVLNSIDSMIAFHWRKLEPYETRLDEVSIGLLRNLVEAADAKIVISSTWRIGRVVEDFIKIFEHYGWTNAPVIGMTGRGGRETVRGDEIQEWIDKNNVGYYYAIIDDDSDMLESQLGNFVHVDGVSGFRLKDLCHALNIFGIPDKDLEAHAFFSTPKNY